MSAISAFVKPTRASRKHFCACEALPIPSSMANAAIRSATVVPPGGRHPGSSVAKFLLRAIGPLLDLEIACPIPVRAAVIDGALRLAQFGDEFAAALRIVAKA